MTTANNKDFGITMNEGNNTIQNKHEKPKKPSLWKQIIHFIFYTTGPAPATNSVFCLPFYVHANIGNTQQTHSKKAGFLRIRLFCVSNIMLQEAS